MKSLFFLRIRELENLLENIQIDSAKILKEKELKLEFLGQELKKNVNTQYIKNILLKFFNSDLSVKKIKKVFIIRKRFKKKPFLLLQQFYNLPLKRLKP